MAEQMQDRFKKLGEVDGILAKTIRVSFQGINYMVCTELLRDARRTLQSTTDLLRQDWDQMARARDAVIEELTKMRDGLSAHYPPEKWRRDALAHVLALLGGSAKGGSR